MLIFLCVCMFAYVCVCVVGECIQPRLLTLLIFSLMKIKAHLAPEV